MTKNFTIYLVEDSAYFREIVSNRHTIDCIIIIYSDRRIIMAPVNMSADKLPIIITTLKDKGFDLALSSMTKQSYFLFKCLAQNGVHKIEVDHE